jgi:eukaryotic-like serine/threonine-protein kinase
MSAGEARAPFTPGTVVGERYRIVSLLARGGFGVVYVADQLATERRVALKLLSSHLDDVSADRLLAEARIASRVSSEHIVQVFDAGVDPDSSLVFVAMELLSGTDLAELVHNEGPRSPSETVEYLRQVAVGLDRVHGVVGSDGRPAPIIHRDLKPANLFLTEREDGSAWIKILDFGAAKVLLDDSHVSGNLRGTPQYMAYEQASGEAITPKTDIWAFGLIAFFLLTGRSYWLGASSESGQAQIFGEVLSLPLVPPSQRVRELGVAVALDAGFDAWFLRCVNRDPAQRYTTAGDAARELARALDVAGSGTHVRSPGSLSASRQKTSPRPAPDAHSGHGAAPRLITPDLAALSASSRSKRPARSRATAALLTAAVLGGAGSLLWWARARSSDPTEPRTRDAGAQASTSAAPPVVLPTGSLLAPTADPARAPSSRPGSTPATRPTASIVPPRGPIPSGPKVGAGRPAASASSGSSVSAPVPPPSEDLYDLR